MPESVPVAPRDRFPPRLANLGYRIALLNGAEVILPPLCDVPAGPFLMGSDPVKDQDAQDDEQPQHTVTLAAFQIGAYPVTVAEYACFVRANGRAAPIGEDTTLGQVNWQTQLTHRLDHPVVMVSWYDAVAYAQWLADLTDQPWRLPSEAEWEKAARGIDGRLYPWGDQFDASRANTSDGKQDATTPVGSYPGGASPYGALDMCGNVWERTGSVFKRYPYRAKDGREREESPRDRALRGGSWDLPARLARVAYRNLYLLDDLGNYLGFRLARSTLNS